MSQENVEVVRRWIDGYNHRDMDGLVELTSPDLEVQSVFAFDFRGYEGLRAYFMELDGAYDERLDRRRSRRGDAGARQVAGQRQYGRRRNAGPNRILVEGRQGLQD
jgi:hypothetical protein